MRKAMNMEFRSRDKIIHKIMHGERLTLLELHIVEQGLSLVDFYTSMIDNSLDFDNGENDELFQSQTKSLEKWTNNHKFDDDAPCKECKDNFHCKKDAFSCTKIFEWWEKNKDVE